jgi:glutamyl-tRNA reductase
VAARNSEQAARLVGPRRTCSLADLTAGVQQADLLICATSAAHDVVTLQHVRTAMAQRARPLTVVDLSVPRNVDPAIAGVPGVRLLDLEGMDDGALADPELSTALRAAAALTRAAALRHAERLASHDIGPVLQALRRRVEECCRQELVEADGRTLHPDQLDRTVRAAAAKRMHHPTVAFRAAVVAGDAGAVSALRQACGAGADGLDEVAVVIPRRRTGAGAAKALTREA